MSNVGSSAAAPDRQGGVHFNYMKGVYRLLAWFGERFPNAVIETCSGGGGRYDLGMMQYGIQIWTSDNTEAKYRVHIQHGSSYGYPMSTMSCHVSNRHGQCEDEHMLDYSFRVAINGPLGYEFNILKADETSKDIIRQQIQEYRAYENLILNGDFYRLKNPENEDCYAYYIINAERSEIMVSYLQNNCVEKQKSYKLKISAAKSNVNYKNVATNEIISGAELKKGITVESVNEERYGKTFYFVEI
jgi:alpha-galactosidase